MKPPVEVIVHLARVHAREGRNWPAMIEWADKLNQELFDPPNVKGWPVGSAWISDEQLLTRQQVVDAALAGTFDQRGGGILGHPVHHQHVGCIIAAQGFRRVAMAGECVVDRPVGLLAGCQGLAGFHSGATVTTMGRTV